MADDPRGLSRARFFPVPHVLAVASALGLSLFFTPPSYPVLLLRLPGGPLPRLLSTSSTAVALRGLLRMEGLLTSFQQTHPRSRPACGMHASACLLILGSVCRTFRKAHGRYCSQKLMPRRGTLNSSPGRSSSFTDRESEVHAAQTHSTTRSLGLPPFPLHLPPQTTGGPAYTGPPQWTTLSPPLTVSNTFLPLKGLHIPESFTCFAAVIALALRTADRVRLPRAFRRST
jgi:hypothetical protein